MTDFIKNYERLDSLIKEHLEVLDSISKDAFSNNNLESLEKLKSDIDKKKLQGKSLNIGIIGRVKAGKSSLLNAMFFKGKNVLPKAATPMTAALTVIAYGDACCAKVEYYSSEDIRNIKKSYTEYKNKYDEYYDKFLSEIQEKNKNKPNLPGKDPSYLAEKKAKREMQSNERLSASYDQYLKMIDSGVMDEFTKEKEFEEIHADSPEILMKLLEDRVGANGKYMPFTKSVELKLPLEELKNLEIVDTPGLDDPVISRSQRTEDYLANAEVVFIVSPAGSFLNNSDFTLIDRLSGHRGEGIRELFLVASQIDNQLYGNDVIEVSEGILTKAIEHIKIETLEPAKANLQERSKESEEIYGKLSQECSERFFLTSGIASSMFQTWNIKTEWDEEKLHQYNLLTSNYPDNFSDEITALQSLDILSGIKKIKEKLDEIKSRKEQIQQENISNFIKSKSNALTCSYDEILSELENRRLKISNSDIQQIYAQKKNLEKLKDKASGNVDDAFDECVIGFKNELKKVIRQKQDLIIDSNKEKKNVSNYTEIRRVFSHTTGWWIFKEEHYKDKEFLIVTTSNVKAVLNAALSDLEHMIKDEMDIAKSNLKKSLKGKLTEAIVSTLKDDKDILLFDHEELRKIIDRFIRKIEIPYLDLSRLSYRSITPEIDSYEAKIEENRAREFLSVVDGYLISLSTKFSNYSYEQIEDICNELFSEEKVSSSLFNEMDKRIFDLEKDVSNKEEALKKIEDCIKALQEVK
ncbi:Dynamin family protein [Succinivibrio dextrinosolvens]|uniref:dynamin family protein n=1 Tax=Succinivibrio dextrinosolvens TaxID=83771 RepID=UPI0008EADA57|nr:dynamin family protein [Succinivibrio dextrinosolvens]SFS76790.1 Dynamin family protein [Succinivibrio dextrinosolvens]